MTDRELMRQAVVALDLAMLHGEYPKDTDIFREISNAANALSARLAQETPYEIGKRLYQEGKGISDIPTAVYSDRDIADALHGYETARRALYDMNKAAEQNGEEL